MIRLLIVDDHELIRAGVNHLVSTVEDVTVVGEAANGDEAIVRTVDLEPDVVLMDLEMPGTDGIAATARLRDLSPDARIVILTSFADRERILAAIDAGAVGYLLKDAEPDEIIRGLRAAAAGDSPLAPRAARTVLQAYAEAFQRPRLTARERDVLSLVGEGLPNKVIAQRLEVSEKTVKAHLTHVFAAIGVSDRTGAALWARAHGA